MIMDANDNLKQVTLQIPAGLHEVTTSVITTAFDLLAKKLYSSQIKYGLNNGCLRTPDDFKVENDGRYYTSNEGCIEALINHLQKGDIIDSIGYLTFLCTLDGPGESEQLSLMIRERLKTAK